MRMWPGNLSNYLSTAEDLRDVLIGGKLLRRLASSGAAGDL